MGQSELDIHKYLSLLKRHRYLFVFSALAITSLFFVFAYVAPKKYEAKCSIIVENNLVSDLIKGITVMPSMDESLNQMRSAIVGRNLILKTVKEVDFGRRTRSEISVEELVGEIQNGLSVTANEKKFIVSFKYSDPAIARDFVNALCRNYIEETVTANRHQTYEAGRFLREQIDLYKGKIEEKEKEISDYKSQQGALANYDRNRIIEEIDSYQRKIFELKMRRNQLEEEKKAADPLRVQLSALQSRLNQMRALYTDSYPEVIAVRSQIESLQEEINSQKQAVPKERNETTLKIDAELKSIGENEAELQQAITQKRELLDTLSPVKASLEKLEAERGNQKNMYDLLLIRQNQSEISKQVELQDKGISYRISEPATTPLAPVSPNRKRIMLLGLAAGLGGSAALLLLLDMINPSIRSLNDLAKGELPVLAVIPLVRSDEEELAILRKDVAAALVAGCWLLFLLFIAALEIMNIPLLERLTSRLHLPAFIGSWLNRF